MLDGVVAVEASEEENNSRRRSDSILHNHEQVKVLKRQVVCACQSVISYELDGMYLVCNLITEHLLLILNLM